MSFCLAFLGLGTEWFLIPSSFALQHSQAVDETRRSVPVAALVSVGAEETEPESDSQVTNDTRIKTLFRVMTSD